MKKIYFIVIGIFISFGSNSSFAQCPAIACPTDIVVNNDLGTCGAVVNYTAPVGTDPCSITNETFNYTGSIVNWTVPAGVTSVIIEARGAEGGYNTSSSVAAGLGAVMIGTFTVIPGDQLNILVGQQPSSSGGNGGGGGSFVTDIANNPLIIAGGGGGSSGTTDSPDKHGQAGTTGGTGAAGGGAGGTAGSGGGIGPSGFQSGAGGGLLTNGSDGWTGGTGGFAFVNGGSGGTANVPANGGFGGGGSGSSYIVGGGGGGYSGGGSGGNLTAGVGGGGGSYNAGTSQSNTSGVNSGNGVVVITYATGVGISTTMISGLTSGSVFPVGITTQTFVASDGLGNADTCSFTVTVIDNEAPAFAACNPDVNVCSTTVTSIGPGTVSDNCPGLPTIMYDLSGATTGSGSGDVSGTVFNVGITTVRYIALDASLNADTCTFNVTVNPLPSVAASTPDSVACINDATITLNGTPVGGTWIGPGVSGNIFTPSVAGVGNHQLQYSFTNIEGCTDSATINIDVLGCAGLDNASIIGINIYPNPTSNFVTIDVENNSVLSEVMLNEINGKNIFIEKCTDKKSVQLDLSNVSSGTYFLIVKTNTGTNTFKLLKK